ncbi:MAG: M28 family peptidase [Pseudomonadota bacterium]|nr:M28 family peptidase [Pseudomonadota bacterium]
MLLLLLLSACDDPPLAAVAAGAVSPTCAALADSLDPARLAADVATLAASPRASDTRRAETRAWITSELAAAGLVATERPFTVSGQSGTNLDAGKGPILVSAHFDSVATTPGADDNATGVAVTLAVARALGGRVRYAFFDVEEPRPATVGREGRNFAFGSQAFADALADDEVRAAFVIESVGFSCDGCQRVPPGLPAAAVPQDGRGIYLVGNEHGGPVWSVVQAAFATVVPPPYTAHTFVVPGNGRLLPQSRYSDNAPLWDRGVDTVMITDTALLRNPHYHERTDAPETLDPAYLAAVARGTIVAVGALAELCAEPPPSE